MRIRVTETGIGEVELSLQSGLERELIITEGVAAIDRTTPTTSLSERGVCADE